MEEISKRDNKKTEGLLTRDSVDFNVLLYPKWNQMEK